MGNPSRVQGEPPVSEIVGRRVRAALMKIRELHKAD